MQRLFDARERQLWLVPAMSAMWLLHDLQTFPVIDSAEVEDEKELAGSHHVPAKGTRDISQNTPRVFESSHSTALANPLDFQLILDALHKRHQDKA